MLLVTAANGNQGKLLVPKLLAKGHEVRALVRSARSADRLKALGVTDVIVGDIADRGTLERSVRGVDAIYHVGPTLHPRERDIGIGLIDAACEANVRHVVFSSVLHAIASDLVQHEIKRDVEERLLKSGLEYTILQPSNYMLPLKLLPVFTDGVFRLSWSLDRKQSLVDLEDVTDVAGKVLDEPEKHAGATYELVGYGRYTAHDLAAILSKVVARDIHAEQIKADTYFKAWFGKDDPATRQHELRTLQAITAHYSAHDFIGNPNVLTWLLDRAPTTFEAFAAREFAAFRRAENEDGTRSGTSAAGL